MIRAISFDLFDTLVDLDFSGMPRLKVGDKDLSTTAAFLFELLPEGLFSDLETFALALHEVDRGNRVIQHKQGIEVSTQERFEKLLSPLPDLSAGEVAPLARALGDRHMECFREQITVPSHHRQVLEELAERFPLFVCSNFTDSACAERVLEEAGFTGVFRGVVISDRVGIRKPRPEIFDAVRRAFGGEAPDILHVGDNLDADVAGAAAYGMGTAWLTRRVRDQDAARGRYKGPGPEHVFEDLADLAETLLS